MDSPIFNKVKEAAEMVHLARDLKDHALSPHSVLMHGREDSYVHVDYVPETGGITLAFVASKDGWDEITKDRYSGRVTPEWSPNKDAKVHRMFLSCVDSMIKPRGEQPSLMDTIVYLTGGYIPRRITCCGYSIGGGLCTIGAYWAAIKFPTADVRCITFGSPRVGSKEFAFAFVNIVANSYRLVYEADPVPHHPRGGPMYSHVSQPIWIHDGDFLLREERPVEQHMTDHGFEYYLKSIREKTGVMPKEHAITAGQVAGVVQDAVSGAADGVSRVASVWCAKALGSAKAMTLSGRALDDYEGNQDENEVQSIVPVMLEGKIAQATLFATHAYADEEEFRKNTGLTDAKLLSCEEQDTQVYVAWLDGGTAVFAFRGTESVKDALADLNAVPIDIDWMTDAFPEVRGHSGFMNQFRSVTDPDVPERHIGLVFDEISGGAIPSRVLCCGHSLGGALATLASAWASYEYPDADVRCVSLGSPRVGNPAFVDACRYLVGGSFRLMHGWDPVPTVPPPGVSTFKHVKGRMWLHDSKVVLSKRPWYASYGLVAGRVGDHFLGGYCDHVSKVSGREIVAEKLGLIRGANNETIAVPVAQDTPAEEVDIPTAPPTAEGAAEAAAEAAEAVTTENDGATDADVLSAVEALDQMKLDPADAETGAAEEAVEAGAAEEAVEAADPAEEPAVTTAPTDVEAADAAAPAAVEAAVAAAAPEPAAAPAAASESTPAVVEEEPMLPEKQAGWAWW